MQLLIQFRQTLVTSVEIRDARGLLDQTGYLPLRTFSKKQNERKSVGKLDEKKMVSKTFSEKLIPSCVEAKVPPQTILWTMLCIENDFDFCTSTSPLQSRRYDEFTYSQEKSSFFVNLWWISIWNVKKKKINSSVFYNEETSAATSFDFVDQR